MKKNITAILLGLIVPAVIIALWWYVTEFTAIPQTILPKISSVAERIGVMWEKGQIQSDLQISLTCVLQGYLVSAVLGVTLGTVMGMSQTAKKMTKV